MLAHGLSSWGPSIMSISIGMVHLILETLLFIYLNQLTLLISHFRACEIWLVFILHQKQDFCGFCCTSYVFNSYIPTPAISSCTLFEKGCYNLQSFIRPSKWYIYIYISDSYSRHSWFFTIKCSTISVYFSPRCMICNSAILTHMLVLNHDMYGFGWTVRVRWMFPMILGDVVVISVTISHIGGFFFAATMWPYVVF